MPTIDWLKKEFHYGYRSGDILNPVPDSVRAEEEYRCGADYRSIFLATVAPLIPPGGSVLELGPGGGSWSRAFLQAVPDCKLTTCDFQNVTEWLMPEEWPGRLNCHQVQDMSFGVIPDRSIDLFFSFGVLCHNNVSNIELILRNALAKMKPGGVALHQFGEWTKLEVFGWERSTIPAEFKTKTDDEIWWPRNDVATMSKAAKAAGWEIVQADLGHIQRDGLMLLRAPGAGSTRSRPTDGEFEAMVAKGIAALEAGRLEEAVGWSERAVRKDSPSRGAKMLRAAAQLAMGRTREGWSSMEELLETFQGTESTRQSLHALRLGGGDVAPQVAAIGNPEDAPLPTSPDTYDAAYTWGWNEGGLRDLIRLCYKTPDLPDNARRYHESQEFLAAVGELSLGGFPPAPATRILDIGCGNGAACWSLAKKGYGVTGIDSGHGILTGIGAARKIVDLDGVKFRAIHTTAEKLPFAPASFEVIWMREVLHHIVDLPAFLESALKLLVPGGILIAMRDHVIWNESQRASFFAEHPFHRFTKDENCHYLDEYLNAFSRAGFRMERLLDPLSSPVNTYPQPFVPGRVFDANAAMRRETGNDLFSFVARKVLS